MNRFVSFLTVLLLLIAANVEAQIRFGLPTRLSESLAENPWTGSIGAGLNGKSGNSENVDINMTLNLARDTELASTTLLASYFYLSLIHI